MKIAIGISTIIAPLSAAVEAHTLVRAVYINGAGQGTFKGIRPPAFNGPPLAGSNPFGQGSSYQNSPVRDLTSEDMKCNVLGDIPAPDTLQVAPGDIVSFEWGHESRHASDDVIDSSHKGAIAVYISPNPPRVNSWVKIFEEGEYAPGQWAVVPKLTGNKGVHSVRIPAGLKPGQYLLRPELFTLHEAEVAHTANRNRGIQLYMECVQIEVTGSGTVSLPEGVSFPGAYSYTDPGIVYNLYYTSPGAPPYKVPGPTVWSGAAPSVANPPLAGGKKGPLTNERWSTWVGADRTVTVVGVNGSTTKSKYVPTWPASYVTPAATSSTPVVIPPSSTTFLVSSSPTDPPPSNDGVEQWGQCGGASYNGPVQCRAPYTCKVINDYYHQCLA